MICVVIKVVFRMLVDDFNHNLVFSLVVVTLISVNKYVLVGYT